MQAARNESLQGNTRNHILYGCCVLELYHIDVACLPRSTLPGKSNSLCTMAWKGNLDFIAAMRDLPGSQPGQQMMQWSDLMLLHEYPSSIILRDWCMCESFAGAWNETHEMLGSKSMHCHVACLLCSSAAHRNQKKRFLMRHRSMSSGSQHFSSRRHTCLGIPEM